MMDCQKSEKNVNKVWSVKKQISYLIPLVQGGFWVGKRFLSIIIIPGSRGEKARFLYKCYYWKTENISRILFTILEYFRRPENPQPARSCRGGVRCWVLKRAGREVYQGSLLISKLEFFINVDFRGLGFLSVGPMQFFLYNEGSFLW